MTVKTQEIATVTIAESIYAVTRWADETVIVSKRGTGYIVREGIHQPYSFPAGTPLNKRGNPVKVMNVGGIIEEVK